jgi:hypothetical protein
MSADDALIEAIAEAQWNSAIANNADSDAPPWKEAQPWDRDWALMQARVAYAAMVEHLGLTEETRTLDNGWGGFLTDSDGSTKTYGRAATVQRRLVSRWVEVQP